MCGMMCTVMCVCVCLGCLALCCLPVFTCKVTSDAGACPCLPLLDCIGCVPPASLAMRASVRKRYGIPVRTRIHELWPALRADHSWLFQTSPFMFVISTSRLVLFFNCGDDAFYILIMAFKMGAAQAAHPQLHCCEICRPPM